MDRRDGSFGVPHARRSTEPATALRRCLRESAADFRGDRRARVRLAPQTEKLRIGGERAAAIARSRKRASELDQRRRLHPRANRKAARWTAGGFTERAGGGDVI